MNTRFLTVASLAVLFGVTAYGQKSDLAPMKQREEIVSKATALVESMGKPVVLPENLINPFVGRVEVVKEEVDTASGVSVVEALADADLLARLAAQIPVSGTATLGGDALLLLGQKRLKAGDVVRISFEGKSYELTITHVGTTSFTVGKDGLTHTRPTRLSR